MAAGWVDRRQNGLAGLELGQGLEERLPRLGDVGDTGDMGGDEHPGGSLEQRVSGERFLLEHVEGRPGQRPRFQRREERRRIEQLAAGNVN